MLEKRHKAAEKRQQEMMDEIDKEQIQTRKLDEDLKNENFKL